MRYIEVRYKCKCMKEEAVFQVPERHSTDDLIEWMEGPVRLALWRDHHKRSPLCVSPATDYIKIPLDGEFVGQGKGGLA